MAVIVVNVSLLQLFENFDNHICLPIISDDLGSEGSFMARGDSLGKEI